MINGLTLAWLAWLQIGKRQPIHTPFLLKREIPPTEDIDPPPVVIPAEAE